MDAPIEIKNHKEKEPRPPRISLLWHEAYRTLKVTESKLMTQYETEAALSAGLKEMPIDKDQLFLQIDHEFDVKDFVEPVVSAVEWSKDYIGDAIDAASYPPASLAWAGLCLVLPLVLNPHDQEAVRTKSIEHIAVIIWQCALREEAYDLQDVKTESNQETSVAPSTQDHYRSAMKDLYMEILKFEAKAVHFLSGNTGRQIIQEMVKWNDWKGWYSDVLKKKQELESLEIQYEKLNGEEKWKQVWRRKEKQHKETMDKINAVKSTIEEFRADVAKARVDSDRQGLIMWLKEPGKTLKKMKRPEPSPSDSKFGEWLFCDMSFHNWKTNDNSFLWLRGKAGSGKSVLNSNVIQHLDHEFGNDPFTAVAYFFISFKTESTLNPSTLLRTLIAQLLAGRPDLPEPLQVLQRRRRSDESPTQEELKDALKAVASGFKNTYIIIDGLDECPNKKDAGVFKANIEGEPREILLKLLKEIRKWDLKGIHLYVGSRPNKDIQYALHEILQQRVSTLIDLQEPKNQDHVKGDINRYIDEQLEEIYQLVDKPSLKDTIKRSLLDRSDGM